HSPRIGGGRAGAHERLAMLVARVGILACLWCATASMARQTVLYVSTQGNDSWSGRGAEPTPDGRDGPLASLTGARDKVRAVRAAGTEPGPVRVVVRGGVYHVDGPLELGPEDSGRADAPVWFEAAPGEYPEVSGGRVITGWRQAGAPWTGTWEAPLPTDFP